MEAARSLAIEAGVASVTLTAVASRAGIHYSAVRRYFTSHKEVLLHLSAEGWVRWSNTVSEKLAEPGAKSPSRIAETLARPWPTTRCSATCWPTCICTWNTRWMRNGSSRSSGSAPRPRSRSRIPSSALPELGRSGSLDILLAAYSLAATLWQVANPRSVSPTSMPRSPKWFRQVESGLRVRAHPPADGHVHRPHRAILMNSGRGRSAVAWRTVTGERLEGPMTTTEPRTEPLMKQGSRAARATRSPRSVLGKGASGAFWLVLTIAAVVAVSGFVVYRLHGVFGVHKGSFGGGTSGEVLDEFNAKTITLEVWGHRAARQPSTTSTRTPIRSRPSTCPCPGAKY